MGKDPRRREAPLHPDGRVGFKVVLQQCTDFSHAPCDKVGISEPAVIVAQDLDIPGAQAGERLHVDCVMATLQARHADVRIEPDTGGEGSLEALTTAARDNWREWNEKNRRNA